MDELAEQAVDAINDIAGKHPGHRAAHAKGTLLAGTFTPSASGLTTAAHMQDEPVRVTARFSNGGGDPGIPDYAKEGRGLAVKFYLPDGSRTDVVALSLPCFFARTPEDFLEFTRARKPDPETGQPDFEKIGAWLEAHPEAGPAIQAAARRRTRRRATRPSPTTRSTRSAGRRRTEPSALCATASSPRPASARSPTRTPRLAVATTSRRRSPPATRRRSG